MGLSPTYVIHEYTPACDGNTRTDTTGFCTAAASGCANARLGYVLYWVYEATVVRATGTIEDPPGWQLTTGTACLGPNDPGISPTAAIGGILADELKRLIVVKGLTHVTPAGTTLVHYDNGYWTDAGTYTLTPVDILGHRVVVTATPASYDWHFGDGTTAQDAGPGKQGTKEVGHAYDATGTVAPYVVITWTGTFTVDGGPSQSVLGNAITTGAGTTVVVREARAELVS